MRSCSEQFLGDLGMLVIRGFRWLFGQAVNIVDGRHPANHLGCIKPCK